MAQGGGNNAQVRGDGEGNRNKVEDTKHRMKEAGTGRKKQRTRWRKQAQSEGNRRRAHGITKKLYICKLISSECAGLGIF